MARLLHLDGPPGVGKSTLARRWAADHPGTFCCDIDVLRTMVGGWEADFAGTGALVRPAALALIGAYLATGHDVVLPQLLADDAERARFGAAAREAGADYVHVVLHAPLPTLTARFEARPPGPLADRIRHEVATTGSHVVLARLHARFAEVATAPAAMLLDASSSADETYEMLLATL